MPISGIFNMFSSLANNSFNAAEAAKNRRWQEQMYDKQYTDNVNLWQMQQEYNSPENQVARLKAAGINPNLALSNISTGSASSAPAAAQAGSGAQATGTPAHFAGLTEGVLNLLKSKDERNLLKEQANKLKSNALLDRIDAITRYEEATSRIISNLSGANKAEAERMLTESMRRTEEELRGYKVQQYVNEAEESLLRQFSAVQFIAAFPVQKQIEFAEAMSRVALNEFNTQHDSQKLINAAQQIIGRKLNQQEKEQIFEALKKTIIFEPTKNMSVSGAGATIGNVLGTSIKNWFNKWKK